MPPPPPPGWAPASLRSPMQPAPRLAGLPPKAGLAARTAPAPAGDMRKAASRPHSSLLSGGMSRRCPARPTSVTLGARPGPCCTPWCVCFGVCVCFGQGEGCFEKRQQGPEAWLQRTLGPHLCACGWIGAAVWRGNTDKRPAPPLPQAAYYPESPSPEQQGSMQAFFTALGEFYPCQDCAGGAQAAAVSPPRPQAGLVCSRKGSSALPQSTMCRLLPGHAHTPGCAVGRS